MPRREETVTRTKLDKNLHRPRMKAGIVPADTRIYLKVAEGPDKGKVFDLSPGGSYLVGRMAGDVPLADEKVSYRHAEIKILGPEAYFLVDLASTNGTFLNGTRVEREKFGHGDEVRIGDSLLQNRGARGDAARIEVRAAGAGPGRRAGGESGIRTHGGVSPTHAFQACSFSHSDISPRRGRCLGFRVASRRARVPHASPQGQ